jgi:hypothetical protein
MNSSILGATACYGEPIGDGLNILTDVLTFLGLYNLLENIGKLVMGI